MRFRTSLLASMLALCFGCSRTPVATVTGIVTLDGKEISDASIQFWPKAKLELGVYAGRTDANGRFLMRTREIPEVQPGEYHVAAREVKDGSLPGPGVTGWPWRPRLGTRCPRSTTIASGLNSPST